MRQHQSFFKLISFVLVFSFTFTNSAAYSDILVLSSQSIQATQSKTNDRPAANVASVVTELRGLLGLPPVQLSPDHDRWVLTSSEVRSELRKATEAEIETGVRYWKGELITTPIARPFRPSRKDDVTDITELTETEALRLERIGAESLLHGEGEIGMLVAGASSRMNTADAPPEVLAMDVDGNILSKAAVPIGRASDGTVTTYLGEFGTNVARLLGAIETEAGKNNSAVWDNNILLMSTDAYRPEHDQLFNAHHHFGLRPEQEYIFHQPVRPKYIATPADTQSIRDRFKSQEEFDEALVRSKAVAARLNQGVRRAVILEGEEDPLGHGEFFHQLVASGELLRIIDAGKKWIFVKNVDNYAAKFDRIWLRLLGLFIDRGLDFQPEVSPRTPGQKGGSLIVMTDNGTHRLAEDPEIEATNLTRGKTVMNLLDSYWFNDAVAFMTPRYVMSLYKKEGQTDGQFIKELREADQQGREAIAERGRRRFPSLLDTKPAKGTAAAVVKRETNMWQSTGVVPADIRIQAVGVRGAKNVPIEDYLQRSFTDRISDLEGLRFMATKQWTVSPDKVEKARATMAQLSGRDPSEVTDNEVWVTLETYEGNKILAGDLLRYNREVPLVTPGLFAGHRSELRHGDGELASQDTSLLTEAVEDYFKRAHIADPSDKWKELIVDAAAQFHAMLPHEGRLATHNVIDHILWSNVNHPYRIANHLPVTVVFGSGVLPVYSGQKPRLIAFTHADDFAAVTSAASEVDEIDDILAKGGSRWYQANDQITFEQKIAGDQPNRITPLLPEGMRLAEAMLGKNAWGEVFFDGGKTIFLAKEGADKESVVRRWTASSITAHFLLKHYIAGPDMGLDEEPMAWMVDEAYKVQNELTEIYRSQGFQKPILVTTSRRPDLGSYPHTYWTVTSIGVVETMLAALRDEAFIDKYGLNKDVITLAIQGYGDVGSGIVAYLQHLKLENPDDLILQKIRIVGVSDKNGTLYGETGLSFEELLRIRQANLEAKENKTGKEFFVTDAYQKQSDEVIATNPDGSEALFMGADVIIPAAQPNIFTTFQDVQKIKQADTKLLVEGANNSITQDMEDTFHSLGIPVFYGPIANFGGIKTSTEEFITVTFEGEEGILKDVDTHRVRMQSAIRSIAKRNAEWLITRHLKTGVSIINIHREAMKHIRTRRTALLNQPTIRMLSRIQELIAVKELPFRIARLIAATEIAREEVISQLSTTGFSSERSSGIPVDQDARDRLRRQFNANKGGAAEILGGRINRPALPRPLFLIESDHNTNSRFLRNVADQNLGWLAFAGGHAERQHLPEVFHTLGIAGLTPAILKQLPQRSEAAVEVNQILMTLIENAQQGIVESLDDLSLIQRQLLQLRYDIEHLIGSPHLNGFSLADVLAGVHFTVVVNQQNYQAITNQLRAIHFAGFQPNHIYILKQQELPGLEIREDGTLNQYTHATFPEGHGAALIDTAIRTKDVFTFDTAGHPAPLGEPIAERLYREGVDRLLIEQISDLHLFGDMALTNRFDLAQQEEGQGVEFVAEFVRNVHRKEGGVPLIDADGGIHIRDRIALREPALRKHYDGATDIYRLLGVITVKGLRQLKPDSLPAYFRERRIIDSEGKEHISFTAEIFSGDASSILKTNIMQEEGIGPSTFKDRSQIPAALGAIDVQNKQPNFASLLAQIKTDGARSELRIAPAVFDTLHPAAIPAEAAQLLAQADQAMASAAEDLNASVLITQVASLLGIRGVLTQGIPVALVLTPSFIDELGPQGIRRLAEVLSGTPVLVITPTRAELKIINDINATLPKGQQLITASDYRTARAALSQRKVHPRVLATESERVAAALIQRNLGTTDILFMGKQAIQGLLNTLGVTEAVQAMQRA
ncbi:MAG: hypothetical protein COW12_10130, partial [Candidatus Omnitrophica bacterium CG12_big_fil_rev_8_21_14_0_65_45_16]